MRRIIIIFFVFYGFFYCVFGEADSWKDWLVEVEPIMSRLELSVVKILKTEEERIRFREAFWKARDPNPRTKENEYRIKYNRRVYYAKKFLNGVRSDRGRIYLILGKPTNKTDYTGHHSLVDCELWNYERTDKPGLLPFMNLVFYKPNNTGDYQLYHPGIHGPRSLLSPQYANNITNRVKAYREIKHLSSELASASLSIVPGEGDAYSGSSISSSNFALNRIYTLPHREAAAGYARKFISPDGHVEVTHSTREIRGYGYISVNRRNHIPFVHYALMPQALMLKLQDKNVFSAHIELLVSVEDLNGAIVYQDKRTIRFKSDPARKQKIDKQKVVFRDFFPLIGGEFDVTVTFMNLATREFFRLKQRVSTGPAALNAFAGYQVKLADSRRIMPFSYGNYIILTDPRGTFNQKDVVRGFVWSPAPPVIRLESMDNKTSNKTSSRRVQPVLIDAVHQSGHFYKFLHPLNNVKDGKYRLVFQAPGKPRAVTFPVHVLPDYIRVTRPFVMEKPESANASDKFHIILGRQCLNARDYDQAVDYFKKIPQSSWGPDARPLIANAFYKKEHYAKVMELLDTDATKKTYPVLQMLANASIELKLYPKALKYLEQLRRYGDTVEINHLLASTHLCMGNRDKARACYDHARELRKKKNKEKSREFIPSH